MTFGTTLTEGSLTFDFADVDSATKYDDWSFYRNQFNSAFGGTKAVDLILVKNDKTVLIEVKDYRQHRRTKTIELGDEVAQKVRDTLAGLVAAKCNANDANERRFARQALAKQQLSVVLHLEQPAVRSRLFGKPIDTTNLQLKLKQKLKPVDAHPEVVCQRTLRPAMDWTVRG